MNNEFKICVIVSIAVLVAGGILCFKIIPNKDSEEVSSVNELHSENNSNLSFEKDQERDKMDESLGAISNSTSFINDISTFIMSLDKSKNGNDIKYEIINKIIDMQKLYDSSSLNKALSDEMISNILKIDSSNTISLISGLLSSAKDLLSSSKNIMDRIIVKNKEATINAVTAGKVSGSEYNVKLNANIYYAKTDGSGNPTSKKWVVALHGTFMDGQTIANSYGKMYLDNGYNVIAPDSRGFGSSEGSIAWGYVEAHDVWDWINYINNTYGATDIIVHGLSLGGGTVVQLSGLNIDGKSLRDNHVIGLVDDCGYTTITGLMSDSINQYGNSKLVEKMLGLSGKASVTDVVGKDNIKRILINQVRVGLTNNNFDEYENGLNSLKKANLPLLIIHGDKDTIVLYENSNKILSTAQNNKQIPYVNRYTGVGMPHAFITAGLNYNDYKSNVDNFISKVESLKVKDSSQNPVIDDGNRDSDSKNKDHVSVEPIFKKISFNDIINFFKSLFKKISF